MTTSSSKRVPLFRHGRCERPGCEREAIFRVRAEKWCLQCKEEAKVVFAPFLGQQEKFLQRRERVVFTGGAGGGGKSVILQAKFGQQLDLEHRRWKANKNHRSKAWGVYFRRTSPDFKQAVQRSYDFFPALDKAAKFNSNEHTWTLPSCGGAVFEFAHMEHPSDRFKYKSREFTYIAVDEGSEFEELMVEYIETRLRTSDRELEPFLQLCIGSNPDGPHMLWLRERFIEPCPPETVMQIETKLRDGRVLTYEQVFIPSRLDDNPILMESGTYEASLINKRPEIRRAILDGDWYISAGAYLVNVWRQELHVCEDHDPPKGAKVFRAADWGVMSPSSIGWWYEDADGGLTCFAHLRTVGLTVDKVCEKIRAIESRYGLWDEVNDRSLINFARNPLDNACFGTGQGLIGARTIAKDFASRGIRWIPARKGPGSRIQGASQIVQRMSTMIPAAYEGATEPTERERPMLRYCRSCVSPIKTLPVLAADKDNANDVDTDGDDHDWDMTMYACLEKPLSAPEEREYDDDDEEPPLPAARDADPLTLGAPIR